MFSLTGLASAFYFVNLKPQLSIDEKQQIERIVFSGLFDYFIDHPDADPDYFFIGTSGSDPSPKVLNSFADQIPKVAAISSSKMTFGFSAPVTHISDQSQKGIIINLETIDKQADGKVRVLISLYQKRGSSDIYEYILSKNDEAYQVISIKHPTSS
ncbi:MAG: hypothetical protein FH748_16280 [Balneolaceae bacterium]|nr:hypothetical protein [Balneolaceae bacterium]